MRQAVMTVEEQLAAALAEVESLRTAIAEKDCIIRDLQPQASVAPQESLRPDEREGPSFRSRPAVTVR